MLTLEQAKATARNVLDALQAEAGFEIVLLDDATSEFALGWVFFYQSKEFVTTGAPTSQLAGNAPIIVNRFTGAAVTTGTAQPIEHYIAQYVSANGGN